MRLFLALFVALHLGPDARAQHGLRLTVDSNLRFYGPRSFNRVQVVDVHPAAPPDAALVPPAGDSLAGTLQTLFQHWFERSLPLHEAPDLTVAVRDFFLEDDANVRVFHLRSDLLLSWEGQFSVLASIDSVWETPRGVDHPYNSIKMVSGALFRWLTAVAAQRRTMPLPLYATRSEALEAAVAYRKRYPLYTTDSLKAGIYHTPLDLLLQTPAPDTAVVYQRYKQVDLPVVFHNLYLQKPDGTRGESIKPGSCFAVCTGKELFVTNKRAWTPLVQDRGEYYATQYFVGTTRNIAGIVFAGAVFNVVGALVAYGMSSNNSANVRYTSRFDPEAQTFRPYRRIGSD